MWRHLRCISCVAGRTPSISDDVPMCIERAAPQNAHVQHVRAGALQIDASHLIVLNDPSSLRLPPAMSHYYFLLPGIPRHTSAFRLSIDASRLIVFRYPRPRRLPIVTPRAAICFLGRPRNSKRPFLQGPRRPSLSTRFAPNTLQDSLVGQEALRAPTPPPHPRATRSPPRPTP